jgi:hypothetical protein
MGESIIIFLDEIVWFKWYDLYVVRLMDLIDYIEPDFSSVVFGLPHTKSWPKHQLI